MVTRGHSRPIPRGAGATRCPFCSKRRHATRRSRMRDSWPIKFGDIVTAGSSDHCSDKIEILPHALFDHIVRQEQKGFAYRQAETFGRFKIDDELELIR